MAEFFLGQIIIGGWNFAPFGSALCNGQVMSIAQNTALFSLLGTTYGGNGQTTFALPNLQGRRIKHWGNGIGLTPYVIGEVGGAENVTATISNMPAHTHTATFTTTAATFSASGAQPKATTSAPAAGSVLGHADDLSTHGTLPAIYCPSGTTAAIALGGLNVAGTVGVSVTGNSIPMSILTPFNTVTMCIVTSGIFPTRN